MSQFWNEKEYLMAAETRFPCEIGGKTYTLKEFLEGYVFGTSKRNTFVQIPRATVKKEESLTLAQAMLYAVKA